VKFQGIAPGHKDLADRILHQLIARHLRFGSWAGESSRKKLRDQLLDYFKAQVTGNQKNYKTNQVNLKYICLGKYYSPAKIVRRFGKYS
jgi:hypothetical protein